MFPDSFAGITALSEFLRRLVLRVGAPPSA
jgi:hypothetical protein